MKPKKQYFMYLDILRLISCIAVFLYHLNILKGGYLAVCSFFVISGFLSCYLQSQKEKFSLKNYYISKLLKLYIPLTIIVLSTIVFLPLIPDLALPNLKPEIKSILLGYNNFWQLSTNLDYFAKQIDSPFMHLWYVSILLQFDLIFPLLYIPLRKLGDKLHKSIPCIISLILTIAASIYFYITNQNQNIMYTYYNTFSRSFALLFGVTLGLIHHYYQPLIPKFFKNKSSSMAIFILYIGFICGAFTTIDSSSHIFPIAMLITTFATCRIIDYAINLQKENKTKEIKVIPKVNQIVPSIEKIEPEETNYKEKTITKKIIKYFAGISYEFYILQYPIIFFLQYFNLSKSLKILITTISLIILSCLYHYILTKNKEKTLIKYILKIIVLVITFIGIYKFTLLKDNTKEMAELKAVLAENEVLIESKNQEYDKNFQEKQQEFEQKLKNLSNDESKLSDLVKNIPAVAMGDSVMESVAKTLYQTFPNIYVDALYERTAYAGVEILTKLSNSGKIGDPVIIEFGANGNCTQKEYQKIIELCQGKQIFWLTVPNDRIVNVNHDLFELEKKYDNFHVIDWYTMTRPHPEYFVSDKVHLTAAGKKAFIQAIYDGVYNYYKKEFDDKKEALQKEHEETLKQELSFFGNELLINTYKELENNYPNAKYISNKDFNYETFKERLQKEKDSNTLTYKLVFLFDSNLKLTKEQWNEILEICKDKQLTIISTSSKTIENINNPEITLIDCEKDIMNNPEYLRSDKTHLNSNGILALIKIITENIK